MRWKKESGFIRLAFDIFFEFFFKPDKTVKGTNNQQRRKLSELKQKYTALLTLYGEKVENVEELELDLSDVKELLKSQTEEWARRLSEAKD